MRASCACLLLVVAALSGLSACSHRPARGQGDGLALINAHFVDPDRRSVGSGVLLIENGRITARQETLPDDFSGEVVDLGGRWVMPGLVDLHVHGWGNPAPLDAEERAHADQEIEPRELSRLVLKAGVTALLDLGGDETERFKARAVVRAEASPHAELFVAGPVFIERRGARHAHRGGARIVSGPRDARSQVRELAASHPDVIKIIYDHTGPRGSMTEETMRAIAHEAHKLGIKTVVHIGTWRDARQAIEAGVTVVTHLYDDELIPESLVRLYASRGVLSIPTMAVQCDFAEMLDKPQLLETPLLKSVASPTLLAAYRDVRRYSKRAQFWSEWQHDDCRANDFVSLKRLSQAGVRLLTGSDSGNLGVFEGYSVHRELALMVEAGVPLWDALAGGTTKAAAFLGLHYGVAPGDEATLVVLDADPTTDIRNTMKIEKVLVHGRFAF